MIKTKKTCVCAIQCVPLEKILVYRKKVLTSNGTGDLLQSDPSYEYILTSNTFRLICSIPNTVPQIWIFITIIAPTTTNVSTITSPSFFISGPDHSFKTFPYNTVSFVFQLIHRLAFLFIQSEPPKCSCFFSATFKGIFHMCKNHSSFYQKSIQGDLLVLWSICKLLLRAKTVLSNDFK